jgi:hypothetical protein
MAGSDCMLDRAGAAERGIASFRASYLSLNDLLARARVLQDAAMAAKLRGDHTGAVALYRELLPHVIALEEMKAFPLPTGFPTQLVERAIEIEEMDGKSSTYSQ